MKGWENLGTTENVNEMAKMFGEHIEEALNEVAPWKTVKVRTNHVFGLFENTKKNNGKRDVLRKECQSAEPSQKKAAQIKYKKMRNKATSQLRKDNMCLNSVMDK